MGRMMVVDDLYTVGGALLGPRLREYPPPPDRPPARPPLRPAKINSGDPAKSVAANAGAAVAILAARKAVAITLATSLFRESFIWSAVMEAWPGTGVGENAFAIPRHKANQVKVVVKDLMVEETLGSGEILYYSAYEMIDVLLMSHEALKD